VIEKLIVAPDDLFERVQVLYREGLLPGDLSGWPSLNQFYTIASRQCTLVTGIPGMGKSEWLDALMVNLAVNYGWTFAVFSPENHPIELHVSKLIEKYVGEPFRMGPSRRMDAQRAKEGALWVLERFIFLEPAYRDYQTLMGAAVRYRCASEKFGVVLDPWNTLEHLRPSNLSETEYISATLTDLTQWTRSANLHLWIVAHPAKIYKGADGKRSIPTPYDIAGSAHWYNKADNIICVHRDQAEGNSLVQVWVQKVRFKHIGRVGGVELHYDPITGRYADLKGEEETADAYRAARGG